MAPAVDPELLLALFDITPAGIAIADQAGRYVEVNAAYCRMFGYAREELLGRTFGLILPEADRHLEPMILGLALTQAADAPTRWQVRHRSGRRLTVTSAFRTLFREDGSVRILTILSDVTALQDTVDRLEYRERELRQLNDSLEQLVAARTRALQEANAELARLSAEDPLTGIANRRAFTATAARAIAAAGRGGQPLSLLLFDLDHFKRINDVYGHHSGDEVLREVVRRAAAVLRASDAFARWGGEEFIVLLPDTALAAALQAGEKVLDAVRRAPVAVAGAALAVTCSAGVVEWWPGETLEAMLRRADDALYRAKRRGRDRIEQAAEADMSGVPH
jgi:diguanylate cyclase (GGDEF)-like protein/PAS domain S-box-containing protein